MMGNQSEPNGAVLRALARLSEALDELNMAGHPYDIGIRAGGVEEPLGLASGALRRTLEVTYPDLNPDRIMEIRAQSGEGIAHAVEVASRELADDQACLTPYERYEQPHPRPGLPGARSWQFPNGWGVSMIPDGYSSRGPAAAARAGEWETCLMAGHRTARGSDLPAGWTHAEQRHRGFATVADVLADVQDLPQR